MKLFMSWKPLVSITCGWLDCGTPRRGDGRPSLGVAPGSSVSLSMTTTLE